MKISTNNINSSETINQSEFVTRLLSVFSIDNKQNEQDPVISLADTQFDSNVAQFYNALSELLSDQVNWQQKDATASFYDRLKLSYPQLLEAMPKELTNLIKLVDKLFDYIVDEKHLQNEMKSLIGQLRPAFFKLAFSDISLFKEQSHPGRMFFNEMTKVALLWSAKDPKTSIVAQQLEQIIATIIQTQAGLDIEQIFKTASEELSFFSIGFIKKIEIFEKRIRESEEGKAKTESAKLVAKKLLQQVLQKKNIPGFVNEFLNQVWEHVIFLEYLKGINQQQVQAITIAKELVVSLQPIKTEAVLNKNLELLSQLIKNLEQALSKTTLSHSEVISFIDNLCHYHKNLISVAKTQIEKQKNSEDIIRLKPITQIKGIDPEEPEEDNDDTNVAEMGLLEWVDYAFDKIPNNSANDQSSKLDSAQINNDKIQEELAEILIIDNWFELMVNGISSRCKLASYIEQNDKYIFVSGSGNKLAEFNSQAIQNAYNNKELQLIDDSPLFERAFDLVSSEAKAEQLKIAKQKQLQEAFEAEQRRLKEIEIARLEEIKNNERIRRLKEKELLAKKEADFIKNENQKHIQDISQLSIGSWVEIKINDHFKKCRLAAKVSSTGKYIFVDRSGIKVKELFEDDLSEFYESGQIKVKQKSDVFDHALSSLITNMRTQKELS